MSGAASRRKGHDYERRIVKELKDLGFDKAQTSRYAAREADDRMVDIVGVPFNIQAKAVKTSINYMACLRGMHAFEQNKERPCMIFHKRGRKPEEELVIMTKEDFYRLIEEWKCSN